MIESRKTSRLETLIGLPAIKNGYVSSKINENRINNTSYSKWHMKHKPYQNDYPSELINR